MKIVEVSDMLETLESAISELYIARENSSTIEHRSKLDKLIDNILDVIHTLYQV
jgi:hypothetical protein